MDKEAFARQKKLKLMRKKLQGMVVQKLMMDYQKLTPAEKILFMQTLRLRAL